MQKMFLNQIAKKQCEMQEIFAYLHYISLHFACFKHICKKRTEFPRKIYKTILTYLHFVYVYKLLKKKKKGRFEIVSVIPSLLQNFL